MSNVSYNRVVVMGRITNDITLKELPSGKRVCEVGLALNDRRRKDDQDNWIETTTFVNVVFWDGAADVLAKYCRKGSPIHVEGRLKLDTWEDEATGQKRSRLKIVSERFQMLPQPKLPATETPTANVAPLTTTAVVPNN